MKAASGWIKKLKYTMIRFKKQWKELPAPIWLMIFPFNLPLWALCLSLKRAQPAPRPLQWLSGVCMKWGVPSLQGRAEWQLSAVAQFLSASAAQQGWAWLTCEAVTGLNAHSVGGSGYRTKHTLTFLLKKVGSGFCVIFYYYCCMLWGCQKRQVIVDFCLPLW